MTPREAALLRQIDTVIRGNRELYSRWLINNKAILEEQARQIVKNVREANTISKGR